MASFKADSRYTGHVDNVDDAYIDSHSDEYSDGEEIPKHMARERKLWLRKYQEELDELFLSYLHSGRMIFGSCFHQTGTPAHFANFVFKYMQPGAN